MGVLYEHWDPIINECFYVGASWTDEDSRPYDFSPRNKLGNYDKRVEQIRSLGKEPEVRLIECSHLTDEELDELEILQIAYWKDLIGERLTNVAKGGRTGWGFAWSEEMCLEMSYIKNAFFETKEGQEWCERQSDIMHEYYKTEAGIKSINKMAETKREFYKTEQGKIKAIEHGIRYKDFLKTEAGAKSIEQMVLKKLEFFQTEEGKQKAIQHGIKHAAFMKTEEGDVVRKKMSEKKTSSWKTSEYRFRMLFRDWHNSNVRTRHYWGA